MPKNLAATVRACGKTIRQIFGDGDGVISAVQKRALRNGLTALMEIIRDLSSEKPKYGDCILRVLQDAHPRTSYYPALMVHHVSDICITLHMLEHEVSEGRDRPLEVRMTDAKFFCDDLADRLAEL